MQIWVQGGYTIGKGGKLVRVPRVLQVIKCLDLEA